MTAKPISIPGVYDVGAEAWMAEHEQRQEQVTCPVCFGKLCVHIILGDDTDVEVKCDFCASGYEPPRGTVGTYRREAKATRIEIEERRLEECANGLAVEYRFNVSRGEHGSSYRVAKQDDLFDTEAEAMAEAEHRKTTYEAEEFERFLRRKNDGQTDRTYSWGVGYHRNQAKDARRQAEYHEKAVVVCKERAKPRKEPAP